ncbi:MAG: hypothetical protein EPN45_19425 [Rhizobiaceae bacterium]|nr:MAG: hypothetical protein EPN45_19425 [Rhizobiaceae bacterium]
MNEDQRIPTLPAAILRQFAAGRNIAKCEISDDSDTAVITYGEQQPGDSMSLSLSVMDAHTAFLYLYNTRSRVASHPTYQLDDRRQTAKLRARIDGTVVDLWFAALPTKTGKTVILAKIGEGDMLFERETQLVEGEVLGVDALDSFAKWCADNEPFLALGRKHGYQIAVSQELKDAIERRLDPLIAARVNAFLQDIKG